MKLSPVIFENDINSEGVHNLVMRHYLRCIFYGKSQAMDALNSNLFFLMSPFSGNFFIALLNISFLNYFHSLTLIKKSEQKSNFLQSNIVILILDFKNIQKKEKYYNESLFFFNIFLLSFYLLRYKYQTLESIETSLVA